MDEKSWLGFGGRVGSGRGIMDVHHFWGWDEGGDAKNASDERSRGRRAKQRRALTIMQIEDDILPHISMISPFRIKFRIPGGGPSGKVILFTSRRKGVKGNLVKRLPYFFWEFARNCTGRHFSSSSLHLLAKVLFLKNHFPALLGYSRKRRERKKDFVARGKKSSAKKENSSKFWPTALQRTFIFTVQFSLQKNEEKVSSSSAARDMKVISSL